MATLGTWMRLLAMSCWVAVFTLAHGQVAQGASEPQCYDTGRSSPGPPDYWTTGCQPGGLIKALQCRDAYCGRVLATCCKYMEASTIWDWEFKNQYTMDRWLPWISEEKPNNQATTHDGFAYELTCKGKHCDNISLRVVSHPTIRNTGQCYWTRRFSEEYGGREECGPSHFVAGLRCFGDYCDDKELYCCKAQTVIVVTPKFKYTPPKIPFQQLLPQQR